MSKNKKKKIDTKTVRSINKNIRSSTRKLKPILKSIVGKPANKFLANLAKRSLRIHPIVRILHRSDKLLGCGVNNYLEPAWLLTGSRDYDGRFEKTHPHLRFTVDEERQGVAFLNKFGIKIFTPYLFIGLLLWYFTHGSGIHSTISGVLLALTIPHRNNGKDFSLLLKLEHLLSPYVAFGIMPLFALANAGVNLKGVTFDTMLLPVPLGILLGLLFV